MSKIRLLVGGLIILTGCNVGPEKITCYTTDGKIFYHAENVRVQSDDGHYRVSEYGSMKIKAVVSGNCVNEYMQ